MSEATIPEPTAETATPSQTRAELQRISGSGYPKVRHILRQHPDDVEHRVSVLGPMVTDRKKRSLVAYLLLLTVWPWLSKQPKPLAAAVYARALSTDTGRKWTPTNVSAVWTDLETRGLVRRRRLARGVVVEPRREDGQADYTSPGGVSGDHRESYFVLPPEFWEQEWFEKLSLPGLAMLLIIAGETSDAVEVKLSNENVADWFGVSARSAEAGIEDLRKHGLLEERAVWEAAPLSPIGRTLRHYYALKGPFSYEARRELQARTNAERARRIQTASIPAGASEAVANPKAKTLTRKKTKKPKATPSRRSTEAGMEDKP